MGRRKRRLFILLILGLLIAVCMTNSTFRSNAASGRWRHDSKGYWYQNANGTRPKSKWMKIGGKWYHFDKKGYRQTGWLSISKKKYYLGTNGVRRTGWQTIKSKKYYFGTNGVMKTGWQTISKKKYYLGTNGVMRKNWQTISKKKYYFGTNGVMRTGWQTISKKKYYFGTNGVMRTGWQTISGKKYYLGTDGVMRTGWQTVSGKKYYLGTDGVMRTKWQTISGKKYYFGSNGVMVTGEQTIDGESYYFDDNGVLTIILDPDGKLERAKKLGLIDTKLYARADQAASRQDVAAILQNVHEKRYGKSSGYLKDMIEGAPGEDAVKKDATRYDFALSLYCSDLEEILDESYSGSGKNYQTWIETCTFTELPVEKGPDAAQTYIRLDGTVGGGSVWDSCSDLQEIEQGTGAPGTQHLFDYGCTPAVNYALVVYDRTDGKKILPMEIVGEKYYFRPYKTMTVRDVALAALRYFNYFEEAPEMVAYEDTRHYDTSIITDELLTKADETTKLPDCSNAELPSTWHGVLVSDMAWVTCQACGNTLDKHLYDYEIQAIKDAGYNYIGLMINFSSLQGPTPESGKLNETRLKELDRVIADCIERDIHVELRCIDVGGMTSADPHDICLDRSTSILSDDSYIPEFAALWKTLAKRYNDIPNRYVNFNLLVEAGVSSEEQYERWFGPAVDAIREESPERCIVADIHAGGITGESMAKKGVALAAHLYEPFEFGQPYDSSKETYDEYLARNVWPYTDKNGKVWDARTAFEYQYMDTSARGVAEVAAKYGVGFMIGEWGLGSSGETRVRYSNETLKNFLTDMTDTMARYGYGWCYGDAFFQYGANAVIPWIEGEEYQQIGDHPLYQDVYVANLFREICTKDMVDP